MRAQIRPYMDVASDCIYTLHASILRDDETGDCCVRRDVLVYRAMTHTEVIHPPFSRLTCPVMAVQENLPAWRLGVCYLGAKA